MKPDVVVTNPYSIDFPLWRETMERHRDKFGRIIIGFYQDNRNEDYTGFIIENTPWSMIADITSITGDWRNEVVNECLKLSSSDRILFLEQDFLADENFWQSIFEIAKSYDVVGFTDVGNSGNFSEQFYPVWLEGIRLHPAFLLVKRSLLNKTSKDFSAYPQKDLDHFGLFSNELLSQRPKFLDLHKIPGWKHYASVTYNFMLVRDGKPPVREDFKEFVRLCTEAKVKQDPRFLAWCEKCL